MSTSMARSNRAFLVLLAVNARSLEYSMIASQYEANCFEQWNLRGNKHGCVLTACCYIMSLRPHYEKPSFANAADPSTHQHILTSVFVCFSLLRYSIIVYVTVFSSPEPFGSHGELIVYPSYGVRPSSSIGFHHFQRHSPKPLGKSKPNLCGAAMGSGKE